MVGIARTGRVGTTLLGLVLILALDACTYRHRYDVGDGARGGPVVYDHWHHYWVGGLVGNTSIDVEELCPSGDATMTLTVPGGVLSPGITLQHAYVVFVPGTGAVAVSNPEALDLVP